MARPYSQWAASPIGARLVVEDGGLTLTAAEAGPLASTGRSAVAVVAGQHGAEFCLWGDDEVSATIGVMMAGAPLDVELGSANGVGWRLQTGQILVSGVVVATGLPVPAKGAALGVLVDIASPSRVRFYADGELVADRQVAIAGALYFAASIACTTPGGLHCVVNAGQWQGLSPAAAAGWYAENPAAAPLRLATEDFMSSVTDTLANTAFVGCLAGDGLSAISSISFWPWDNASRPGAASVRVRDADGMLDASALGALRGQPVRVRQVVQGGALQDANPMGRYVLDRIDIEDDGTKRLTLRNAHDDLDDPLSRAVFLPSQGAAIAWQPQPVIIGAVRSAAGYAVNSDGSQQWLADSPVASVDAVMDRGALIIAGSGYQLATDGRRLVLTSPPVGPVVADVSTLPNMAPATLQQALADLFSRVQKAAWSSSDAAAIDSVTGYAGIGYYAGNQGTPSDALSAILQSYTADWWQDADGVLRLARLIDPDTVADAELSFDLDWTELADDLIVMPDLAPNLTRRMFFQPNGVVLGPGDLITDLVQLTPAMRQSLTSQFRGQVYSSGVLARRYAHADSAAPVASRFDRREDAQREIDRLVAIYAVPRNFYAAHLTARTDLVLRPGQVGRITYSRYGLAAGRKVLVTGVTSDPVSGEHTIKFWGQ